MLLTSRSARYSAISTHLSLLSDRQLGELLETATPLSTGIGGVAVSLEIEGIKVFVKKVPLTDLERENPRSTANFYDLPTFYQYGLGSLGFGVWREVAAHTMTTNWVLSGQHQGFPLTYHWRVLPGWELPLPADVADIDSVVDRWGGSPAIRARITALSNASAAAVLFLEHIPTRLDTWLTDRVEDCDRVERNLLETISFMRSQGFLHFDAHFHNLLADDDRVYFTDFGLATSSRFDLSPAEREFFVTHETYDWSYTTTHLLRWLIAALYGVDWSKHEAFVRECADGRDLGDIPKAAATIIRRYAPLGVVMTKFFSELGQNLTAPYPADAVGRELP
jgi:hypothetical protein